MKWWLTNNEEDALCHVIEMLDNFIGGNLEYKETEYDAEDYLALKNLLINHSKRLH